MATRRRIVNATGESPAGAPAQRGEEYDVEVWNGFLSDVRIFTVMEQTVQLRQYHPVSARIGMEATIRDDLTHTEAVRCFRELERMTADRLRVVIREKIEQGLEVLED